MMTGIGVTYAFLLLLRYTRDFDITGTFIPSHVLDLLT